ncbi:MAG: diguanylate cyclase [Thermosynechococcaceae cyanobacterium]
MTFDTSSLNNNANFIQPLILVTDEDPRMRRQWRIWLEKDAYRVEEATDCASCLVAYAKYHPDLVMLEMGLSDQDGLQCCEQLHHLSGGEYTPLLILTDEIDDSAIERAFALGIADYIPKPVHWSLLRHRLRRLLAQAQQYRRLEAENQQLTRLASLDSLTRIANRRRFDDHLDSMWRQMIREQDWLSIILGDVDFFKAYNDAYGHPSGDQCLQRIAAALYQCCRRPLDLVARYGGEEFGIVLPKTKLNGALTLGARMQTAIGQLQIPHQESHIDPFVTMSFGVATLRPGLNMSTDGLLEATDKALYTAKSLGRNQVYGHEIYEA